MAALFCFYETAFDLRSAVTIKASRCEVSKPVNCLVNTDQVPHNQGKCLGACVGRYTSRNYSTILQGLPDLPGCNWHRGLRAAANSLTEPSYHQTILVPGPELESNITMPTGKQGRLANNHSMYNSTASATRDSLTPHCQVQFIYQDIGK